MIEIKSFNLTDRLDDFIKLPYAIYKDTPYARFWVPPLIKEQRALFSAKHPFFRHAAIKIFVVYNNGRACGRIAAIIDDNYIRFHNEQCGFFGYFDSVCDQTVADMLIESAKDYLKQKGMRILQGPMNPSTNDEVGLLIEGFDSSPHIMMPYNPPYYMDLLERAGLQKAKDLFAYYKSSDTPPPTRIERIVERVKKKEKLKLRNFDMKNFKAEVNEFKKIYNSAWEKNWGFVPMTDEEIDYMADSLRPILDPRITHFIEIQGQRVAATLAVPDFNVVLKRLNGKLNLAGIFKFFYWKPKIKSVRLMALGVKKEFRNKGLEAVLYYEILKAAREAGYSGGELSWTLEDNDQINRGIEAMGGRLYKKYRIYEAEL